MMIGTLNSKNITLLSQADVGLPWWVRVEGTDLDAYGRARKHLVKIYHDDYKQKVLPPNGPGIDYFYSGEFTSRLRDAFQGCYYPAVSTSPCTKVSQDSSENFSCCWSAGSKIKYDDNGNVCPQPIDSIWTWP